jgi:hypothetical protein
MNRTGAPQRFLWVMSLSVAVWLVTGGAVWAGEGSALRVVETEWPGVTVELMSIEPASGETLMVKFTYVNRGSAAAKFSMRNVYYVDTKNKRKYSPVQDSRHQLLASKTGRVEVDPGRSASHWVKFPAPPAGVERIDLYFPGALPLEKVPVQ